MRAQNLDETEIENLFAQLAPNSSGSTAGASEQEIKQLEQLAGRPLPAFYHWFLRNLGRDMGPFGYARVDCSVSTILACYQEGMFPPSTRYFLIGYSTDQAVPAHRFYDLDRSMRDDACVVEADDLDGSIEAKFETFREMLAWRNFLEFRVMGWPYQCRGLLKDRGADVLSQLEPLMAMRGLKSPIPNGTGSYCALLDGSQSSLVSRAIPDSPPRRHTFTIGADEQGTLRRMIGEIATATSLEVKVSEWTPGLP
jgi:hypothetical protein